MSQGLVCLQCRRFLRCRKNGVCIEEGMPQGTEWGPYKLWHADLYECEGCGFTLVTGFAARPLAEHYQPTYEAIRDRFQPIARIDDCGGARP